MIYIKQQIKILNKIRESRLKNKTSQYELGVDIFLENIFKNIINEVVDINVIITEDMYNIKGIKDNINNICFYYYHKNELYYNKILFSPLKTDYSLDDDKIIILLKDKMKKYNLIPVKKLREGFTLFKFIKFI